MDRWAWEQLDPWLEVRRELPIGARLCVIHGLTGALWEWPHRVRPPAVRKELLRPPLGQSGCSRREGFVLSGVVV
jgi:hypothetical protein